MREDTADKKAEIIGGHDQAGSEPAIVRLIHADRQCDADEGVAQDQDAGAQQ